MPTKKRPRSATGERHVVASETTLEGALRAVMPTAARRTLKQLAENGRVTVDGKVRRRLDYPTPKGSVVAIAPRGVVAEGAQELPQGLNVVYADDDIVVVEKPAGMLSIATETEKRRTVYAKLRDYVKATDPRARIFIVHRLDRRTSGLLVFARTPEVKATLQQAFADRTVERVYTAVVEGSIEQDEGTLRHLLVESDALRVHVTRDAERGVEAITRYRVVKRGRHHTLVKISLVTGRKAQIRVQFAHIGHPVVGDREYGSAVDVLGRLALHAMVLSFEHPTTHKLMTFTSKPPREFASLVAEV